MIPTLMLVLAMEPALAQTQAVIPTQSQLKQAQFTLGGEQFNPMQIVTRDCGELTAIRVVTLAQSGISSGNPELDGLLTQMEIMSDALSPLQAEDWHVLTRVSTADAYDACRIPLKVDERRPTNSGS